VEPEETTGRLIADRYRLRAPIGAGGMGEVWEAYDERLDRRVVVKQMIADRASVALRAESLEVRRERFLREIRTTAAIEHLGIPAVFDTGIDRATGRLYVVMQFLRGRELQTLIDEADHAADPLPVSCAAAIGAQIASVLHEVHQHGVVHRDIKPANLMLTPGGIVKVLDFGVAALLGSGSNPRLTQVGMTLGTPPYMSPEQSLANAVGPASDVYALACVLYEVLTGRPPFNEGDGKSYMWHHVHSDLPQIRPLRPDLPADFAALLEVMLDKQPEHRPEAAEVYERLLPLAATEPGRGFSVDVADLDPRLPFARPLGSAVRPRRPAPPASPASSQSPVGPLLTDTEVAQIVERVGRLIDDQKLVQAADLITENLPHAPGREAAVELTYRLAYVRFFAGAYSEAAELFADTAGFFARRYGPDDPYAQAARYLLAQCNEELGKVTEAIRVFEDITATPPAAEKEEAVNRYLDALASRLRLNIAVGRYAEARSAATAFREAILAYQGPHSAALAELDTYLDRLARLIDEPAGFEDGEVD
jgi:serine/threonine protein kinase